jgi:hypothetical protein
VDFDGDDDDRDAAQIDQASAERMVFMTDDYYLGWAIHAIAAAVADEPPPPGPRPPHPPTEWVYFVQQGTDGPIKIGYSKDPVKRFVSLQTGSAVKHRYLGNAPGSREKERELHARFHGAHLRGEWYRPVPELTAYIEEHRFRPDSVWDPADEPVQLW